MSKASRIPVIAIMAVGAFLVLSPGAVAQVTVGQTAPGASPATECEFPTPFDELQTAVSSGASYTVPTGGVITSWSTNAGAGAGQTLSLKIFRPLTSTTYQVLAHDGPRALTPSALNTFAVSIPVQAGDILGLAIPTSKPEVGGVPIACLFETGNPGDVIAYHEQFAADGAVFTPEETFTKSRLNVSATLLPPPTMNALSPASGSVKGGTSVVLAGTNFASVQSVTFGTTAASFTVNSEGQITAISPAATKLSKVPVSVTTVAGAASSPTTFAYEGCKVPKLGGKKLKAAKKSLKKNDCRLGKVKKTGDATAKDGKVIKQNPKSGKILAPGAKVAVKLG